MKFKVGDKVRVTQNWMQAIAGMEGEVVFPETESNIPLIRFPGWAYGHDGRLQIGSRSPLPEGSTEGLFTPGEYLELIPSRLEKPMEYEIGGTLTDANGVEREITRILPEALAPCCVQTPNGQIWVDPTHYIYTPPAKLVPMNRELQTALEKWERSPTSAPDGVPTEIEERLAIAWRRARKEAAK